MSGCGQESPSPGGARSQGKGRKVNTGLRGLVPCTGFPLNCRTPPLLGANGHTTLHSTHVHGYASCAPARLRSHRAQSLPPPVGASPRLVPVPCSPSGRYQTASAVVSDASSSAVASTPLRLRLVPQPPRASTARPGSPRARTAALGRVASPPREVGPALPGRRVAPASAASLSSSARPSPPLAPHRARGGVALPVEDHGGPAATATVRR